MKISRIIAASILLSCSLAFALSCSKSDADGDDSSKGSSSSTSYSNPIIHASIPDPTVIRAQDGAFYLMGTEDIRNMVVYKSTDMITWTAAGHAFAESSRPTFIPSGMMWAPEANYINGKYVLYYSLANTTTGRYGIGVAVASKPSGPYSDRGKIIEQGVDVSTGGICIDEFLYQEDGHNYLFYGSYGGIYYIELSADGLTKLSGEPKLFASSEYEASMIHKHGNYYYYFGSLNGYESNYQLAVNRSTSLFGTYTNKSGTTSLQAGGYEVVFSGNSVFKSTGHCSRIFTDDAGNDWIFLHAYTAAEKNSSRYPHMYKVTWTSDGWPVIGDNGQPAVKISEGPVIK